MKKKTEEKSPKFNYYITKKIEESEFKSECKQPCA